MLVLNPEPPFPQLTGLGFRVQDLEFRVQGLGFRV